MWAFGGNLTGLRAFGGNLGALRGNGADLWRPAAAETVAPANGRYVHSIWGDTSKLTPPRALQGSPLIMTDAHRGQPSGGFIINGGGFTGTSALTGEQAGGDGQQIRGRRVTINPTPPQIYDDPNANTFDGSASINDWIAAGLSDQRVTQGWVWIVDIDGNGADVWLNFADGPTRNNNFQFNIRNCRTLRITGHHCDVGTEVAALASILGGWPDTKFWLQDSNTGGLPYNTEAQFYLTQFPNDFEIFIEGSFVDFRWGGGETASYRTDAFNMSNLGQQTNNEGRIVFQNCRWQGISGSWRHPGAGSHSDFIHFWSDCYQRYEVFENVAMWTAYQGHQSNWNGVVWAGGVPDNLTHIHMYRCRWRAYQAQPTYTSTGGTKGSVAVFYCGTGDESELPSFYFDDVEVADNGMFIPQFANGPEFPETYANLARAVTYHRDFGAGSGQSNPIIMTGNASNGEIAAQGLSQVGETTDSLDQAAPVSAIGHNFVHLWDRDGNLLSEN